MGQNRVIIRFTAILLVCLMLGAMFGTLPGTARAASKFNIGDTVEVTTNLNVRTGPGTSYPEITDPDYPGYAPAGTKGKVIDGPTNADGYVWWKVDFGPGLYSGWSAENWLVKVSEPPASAPVHVSPSNGANDVSTRPTFQWQAVSGVTKYGLYVSKPPYGAANLVFDSEVDYGPITGTSLTLPITLEEGVTYRWNMRAGNDAGWGPFSSSWSFTTATATVTLTLYVHEGSASGPVLPGVRVTGQDGGGNSFDKTTNSSGYVTITGTPGTWSFTASKSGYQTNSWSQSITSTTTKHAYLIVVQKPDLIIEAITWSPSSPSIGETVTFTVTIKNKGTDPAGNSKVYYFIDNAQHGYDYVNSIQPGATAMETFTWKAQAGPHAIKAVADYKDEVAESDETNNEKTVTFSTTALSDLIIESITWSPLNPSVGDTVTFTVTIKNQGSGKAGSSKVYYFVNNVQQSYDYVSSIDSGATATETFTWKARDGAHAIKAVADYKEEVTETDETNNEKTVTFSATALSDLIIESITWSPSRPSIGETVTFTVVIKNQGTGKASSSKVYYFIDNAEHGYDYVDSIDAGATATETFTWKAQDGTHAIKAVADYKEEVAESDEANNEKTVTFSTTALSDLIIESITWSPLNPSIGDTVTFTVTIKNQGTGKAGSSKVYYFIGNAEHGYDYVDSIDAGATVTETFTWKALDGTHAIMAVADYKEEVAESDETNNDKTITFSPTEEIVSVPNTPSGPTTGTTDVSYSYSTGGATSSYGHNIEYRFDWGYGSYSSWSSSTTASHSWSSPGTYTVKAQARCATHTSVISSWSLGLSVSFSLATGAINVSSTPSGAPFTLSDPANYSGITSWSKTDAPVGPYTITWGFMSGYETPQQQSKTLTQGGIISFHGTYQPGEADYPEAEWIAADLSNYTDSARGVGDISYIVIHTMEGTSGGTISWFQNPGSNVSAHYLVSQQGEIVQMVKEEDIAWHAGNWSYNQSSIGIEHEGFSSDPDWTTQEMYQASAALVRYLCDKYDIPKDRAHVLGHNEVPESTHTDPGPYWDWDHYMQLVRGEENQAPIASFTYSPESPVRSGDVVSFDASKSEDPEEGELTYEWDFGDGSEIEIQTDPHAHHRFRGAIYGPKEYEIRLTVKDDKGATDSDTREVTVMPLKKPVEVIHEPAIPIPGVTVFAKMEVSYNWIDERNGEDIYIVSRVDSSCDGFTGIYAFNFIDTHSRADRWATPTVHPLLWWNLLPSRVKEKSYGTESFEGFEFFREKVYGEDLFEGIEVYASDMMFIAAYGWTGIHWEYAVPFLEWSSRDFQPESADVPSVPIDINDLDLAHLASSGELRVYDSQGRVTGLVNGVLREEIPYSFSFDNTVVMLAPTDSYYYELAGTEEGSYGLGVISVEEGEATTFGRTNTPIAPRAIHQYTINWNTLSQGEEGVTLQIDSDGDGTFEQTTIIQPPIASFTCSPENPAASEDVTFDASESYDPDGQVVSYEWHFGDGNTSSGRVITHSYSTVGDYTVTLRVTDDDGACSTYSKAIQVRETERGLPTWVGIAIGVAAALVVFMVRPRIARKKQNAKA